LKISKTHLLIWLKETNFTKEHKKSPNINNKSQIPLKKSKPRSNISLNEEIKIIQEEKVSDQD
jgi:hypothetical protein